MSGSSMYLDIIGPGTVSFDWSASCEINPHYTNNNPQDPDSQYFGLIYDAIWLYLNGAKVENDDEPVFLSGPLPDDPTGVVSESGVTLTVPEGAHRIEWRYEKDPYTDDHQDTAFIDALSWQPDPSNPYPIYAAYEVEGTTWHASEWFGLYETSLWPWVAHETLGWLYMVGGTSGRGAYFSIDHPDIGIVYTTPTLWPFLYRPSSGSWLYYYRDIGESGNGVYYYDYDNQSVIGIP
jgi:hypothetical protein